MEFINILTQGVASLALGYVVLGFQPVFNPISNFSLSVPNSFLGLCHKQNLPWEK